MEAIERTHPSGAAADLRDRPVRLRWGAVFGGSAIGFGLFVFLSWLGLAIGLAAIEPWSASPIGSGTGSALWSIAALFVCSTLGAFLAVRIAGERRRREAALHGAVLWGMAAVAGALLAIPSARLAARAAEHVPRAGIRADSNGNPRAIPRDRVALSDARDAAAKAAGLAAAGCFFSLVGALLGAGFGAAMAAGRMPGRARRGREAASPQENQLGRTSSADGELTMGGQDRPTILPPTH